MSKIRETLFKLGGLIRKSNRILIIFGMALVIVAVWLTISFYADLTVRSDNKLANNVIIAESSGVDRHPLIQTTAEGAQEFIDNNWGYQLDAIQLDELIGSSNAITWRQMQFNAGASHSNSESMHKYQFSIDGKQLNSKDAKNEVFNVKFYEGDSGKTHAKAYDNYLNAKFNHSVLYGAAFSGARSEIIVSEELLNDLGINKDNALGKPLTLSINYTDADQQLFFNALDDDNIYGNEHVYANAKSVNVMPKLNCDIQVFKDYKIVGIISKEYYEINDLCASDSHIWLQEKSLYTSDGASTMPRRSIQNIHNGYGGIFNFKQILTYPSTDYQSLSQSVAADGAVFPFLLDSNDNNINNFNNIVPIKRTMLEYGSFNEANVKSVVLDSMVERNSDGMMRVAIGSYSLGFIILRQINIMVIAAISVMYTLGLLALILGVAAYYNIAKAKAATATIVVDSGADTGQINSKKLLKSLGFMALVALAISAVIAGALCLAINLAWDFSVSLGGLTLSYWYYFAAAAIIVVPVSGIYAEITTTRYRKSDKPRDKEEQA